MRLLRILTLMVVLVVALAGVATAAVSPGTPCSDLQTTGPCVALGDSSLSSTRFALADIFFDLINDPGTVDLGIFVVPGDVVLFEHAGGSLTAPSTWSDVVHFATGPNSSSATMFADGEAGVLLPPGFALSSNAVSIVEVQTGTGTDADFTVYIAGSATYHVHSDAALTPEPIEPGEAPEPSTLTLFIGGSLLLVGFARRRLF